MTCVRLESMIPVFEQAKTVHALDRAATVIGLRTHESLQIRHLQKYG
jgi:hypothetical protein